MRICITKYVSSHTKWMTGNKNKKCIERQNSCALHETIKLILVLFINICCYINFPVNCRPTDSVLSSIFFKMSLFLSILRIGKQVYIIYTFSDKVSVKKINNRYWSIYFGLLFLISLYCHWRTVVKHSSKHYQSLFQDLNYNHLI